MEQEIKRVLDCFLVLRPAAIGIDRLFPFHEMHQLFVAPAQVLVPHHRIVDTAQIRRDSKARDPCAGQWPIHTVQVG
jgi:hypothetical protein